MKHHHKNILIAGLPGSGKTTLIRKLAESLGPEDTAGFFTQEIREHGKRTGFSLTSLDGTTGLLAHVNVTGDSRVGRYGVDVAGFEHFLRSLPLLGPGNRLVIIDEIGKMECLSSYFRGIVEDLLRSPAPFLATVAMKGGAYFYEIKSRQDVELIELNERNRDALFGVILDRIHLLLAS